jgi:hypothetical protein
MSIEARHPWLMPIILATWEARQIGHETPISKITSAKWTGGVAQAVKCLLCKCEAQSSNPSPTSPRKSS